jgi:hypothetical protein
VPRVLNGCTGAVIGRSTKSGSTAAPALWQVGLSSPSFRKSCTPRPFLRHSAAPISNRRRTTTPIPPHSQRHLVSLPFAISHAYPFLISTIASQRRATCQPISLRLRKRPRVGSPVHGEGMPPTCRDELEADGFETRHAGRGYSGDFNPFACAQLTRASEHSFPRPASARANRGQEATIRSDTRPACSAIR